MEVILLERVGKFGRMGDQVKVKDGFGRNYLLPSGKALRANAANRARFEAERHVLEAKSAQLKATAEDVRVTLDGRVFTVVRSAGEMGQLYGSVSTRDIAETLAAEGFSLRRNQIDLNQPMKTIGIHTLTVHLHSEVDALVAINVARSLEEAERQVKGEDLTSAEAIYGDDDDELRPEDFFDPDADYDEEVTGLEGSVDDPALIQHHENFTDTKPISASIIRKMKSDLLSERFEGIYLASKLLLSAEEGKTMQTGFYENLSGVDRFEISALPDRLYDTMFVADPREARAAAYALIIAAPAYRGKLNPSASPEELSSAEIDQFRGGLVRLFSDIGVHYFSYVDASITSNSVTGAKDVQVLVEVSRRLPFDIGGSTVLLDHFDIDDNRLLITSPLAVRVITQTVDAESVDGPHGVILTATAGMTIPKNRHWDGKELPVTVAFNNSVETLDVPVRFSAE